MDTQRKTTHTHAYEREREERYDAKRQSYANLRSMLPADASPLALGIRPARAFAARWSQAAGKSIAAVRLTKAASRALTHGGDGVERPSRAQGSHGKAKVLPHGPGDGASSSLGLTLQDIT